MTCCLFRSLMWTTSESMSLFNSMEKFPPLFFGQWTFWSILLSLLLMIICYIECNLVARYFKETFIVQASVWCEGFFLWVSAAKSKPFSGLEKNAPELILWGSEEALWQMIFQSKSVPLPLTYMHAICMYVSDCKRLSLCCCCCCLVPTGLGVKHSVAHHITRAQWTRAEASL